MKGAEMSRWIDAEKELKELKNMKVEGETFTTAVNFAILVLENAPSIDLVRCGECKYFGEDSVGTYCDRYKCTMMPDGFCSYAERKESE